MPPFRDSDLLVRQAEASQLDDIERRLVRIETRLTRLLHHLGLRSDGTPRNPQIQRRDEQ